MRCLWCARVDSLKMLWIAARRRSNVVQWLNGLLDDFNLPLEATDEELRAELYDGTVFGRILCKLNPGSIDEVLVFR